MSLIITSSAEFDETNQMGVALPFQYRNNLKNPLVIQPNSEIAVESIKLQRQAILDYGNSNTTNFWFGERLADDDAYDTQTSYFIPSTNDLLGSKSPADFAEEFKVLLQEVYSLHPEINAKSIEVNITTDSTTGEFKGFQYKIPQFGGEATSVIPPADTELSEISEVSGTWDGTTLEAAGDDCFLQLLPQEDEGGPLSLHNGSITYSGIGAGDNTIVGLSRPYCFNKERGDYQGWRGRNKLNSFDDDSPFGACIGKKGMGQYGEIFMDYAVHNDGTDIRIYNYKLGATSNIPRMEEVIYYQKNNGALAVNNSSNSSFATGTPIPSASMGDVTFTVENEKVQISVSGKVVVDVVKFDSASFKDQIPAPTTIGNWKMYPTAYFTDNGDSVDITNYSTRTNSVYYKNYPENSWIARTKIQTFLDLGREVSQKDLVDDGSQETVTEPWNDAFSWNRIVHERPIMKPLTDDDTTQVIRNYSGIQNNLIGPNGRRYENIFIMGPNDRYVDRRIQKWQANSAQVLGFEPFSINTDSGMTHTGGYNGASFTSVKAPKATSRQSSFVRVPTLTHETYNFNTGAPSKILFQVPRFDNSGAEVGALYFQNNDKTFIDLKNAAPLRVTDLDVHIVRKDERFVDDLTGSTEVVFIVRPKMYV